MSPRVRVWLAGHERAPRGALDDLRALRTDQCNIGGDFCRALARLATEVADTAVPGESA